jgi:single-strand DNA-binding protein
MASFNKITIVGYLGRDPELRFTPAGDAVCAFSVGTTDGKAPNQTTTWFRVTTWRRQAEVANQYLAKGKLVYIEGRLRTNEYTDREGNKRTSLEVTCTDMRFLSTGERDGAAPASGGSSSKVQGDAAGDGGVMEDDIPF